MSASEEPIPYTLEFTDNDTAFEQLVGFEFEPPDKDMRHLDGWMIVRVDAPGRIVQARMCAPFIGYISPSAEEIFRGGVYNPPTGPECFLDKRRTLPAWKEVYPDSLVAELSSSGALSRDTLQRLMETAPAFFEDLYALHAKPTPWSEQDFLDAEASIAGVANYKPSWRLGCYGREKIERAARAGREPEQITAAHRRLKKLQDIAYKAAEALRDFGHQSRRKDFVSATTYDQENAKWMERLKVECPGFSDWVYHDAIHDWGFHMSR